MFAAKSHHWSTLASSTKLPFPINPVSLLSFEMKRAIELDSKMTPEGVSRTGALPLGEIEAAFAPSNSGTDNWMELYSAAIKILKARKFPGGV